MRSDTIKKGPERAPHRSLLRATGVGEEDWGKPFIAICCSHVDIIPGHVHLDAVGNYVKAAVRRAGGVPFIFHTVGVDDGIAMGHDGMKYSLPSREIIADSVETMLRAHQFDGMVCIPNCDKIVPGMLMAAMRCNVPAIFVSGGPMEAGEIDGGKRVDLINAFMAVGEHKIGKMSDEQFEKIEQNACPTCGSCSGMFTANSMNCLCEALGVSLPGNGTILATSARRLELYRKTAERIIGLVQDDIKPRDICTKEAFDNAMILDMAMGGSTNTLLHVLAIANEAGVDFGMERINQLSLETPNICKVAPSPTPDGRIYHIQDVQRAGGIHSILGSLVRGKQGLLHEGSITVTGKSLGDNIVEWDLRSSGVSDAVKSIMAQGSSTTGRSVTEVRSMIQDGIAKLTEGKEDIIEEQSGAGTPEKWDQMHCIREVENAYSKEGGLTILYGNLAPEGSVVKTAGVDPEMMSHSGPAVIFESQEDACEGILTGKVKAGDVAVIRYEGPRGGPGMQEMLSPTSYIKGMGLGKSVSLITDGRFSGGTAGACIGHISPEAAEGGVIGLLRSGDIIAYSIPDKTLEVKLTDEELEARRKEWNRPPRNMDFGWLKRYQRMVTNAAHGAVLDAGDPD
jgi:dihydroxy-acid dehydratase